MSEEWRTEVSSAGEGSVVRGVPLSEVTDLPFSEAIWLVLQGDLPTEAESAVFDAVLSTCVDHGVGNPSSISARTVQSGGNGMNASVAAGVLALGDSHGGAIEEAMRLLKSDRTPAEIVDDYLAAGERLPGLGHRVYDETDPRSERLLSRARDHGVAGDGVEKVLAVREAFADRKVRLVLNVDGAIAAVMTDLGWDYRLGKGVFIVARTPGLVAHVREEMDEPTFRRAEGEYVGE